MAGEARTLRDGLADFDQRGAFSEEDYLALRRALAGAAHVDPGVLDGFIGLFFERHVLDDVRRAELLALDDEGLLRAVRHRFRQVVAGAQDSHNAWHALSAHVRDALASLAGPGSGGFPTSLQTPGGFSAIAVERAVAALWAEWQRKPSARDATQELFSRYLRGVSSAESTGSTRDFPAVMRARLDAQRLARGILELLSAEEKDLLRTQLDGESVEEWAKARGVSRATAYRLLSRVKALCKGQFDERTRGTQLAVLDVLRGQL